MFVIERSKGEYVAKPGLTRSYVKSLKNARKFKTVEAAESEKCDDESIVDLEKLLDGFRR